MSTILLCWYAMGWSFVAVICRDFYEEELTMAMLLTAIILWPVGLLIHLGDTIFCKVGEIVVWRKP